MGILDKNLQERILKFLHHRHDNTLTLKVFDALFPDFLQETTIQKIYQNPQFISQYHIFFQNIEDLIAKKLILKKRDASNYEYRDYYVSIAPKGLNYLEPNQGIQIEEMITVKLDGKTLQTLIDYHLHRSELPEAEKSKIKEVLSKVGDAGLSKLTEKALDMAFSSNPQVLLNFIQNLL